MRIDNYSYQPPSFGAKKTPSKLSRKFGKNAPSIATYIGQTVQTLTERRPNPTAQGVYAVIKDGGNYPPPDANASQISLGDIEAIMNPKKEPTPPPFNEIPVLGFSEYPANKNSSFKFRQSHRQGVKKKTSSEQKKPASLSIKKSDTESYPKYDDGRPKTPEIGNDEQKLAFQQARDKGMLAKLPTDKARVVNNKVHNPNPFYLRTEHLNRWLIRNQFPLKLEKGGTYRNVSLLFLL